MTALVWKDIHDVHMLMNMELLQQKAISMTNIKNAIKPEIIADYSKHMGYVDKTDRMTDSYSISHWTWK
jgi:hypothetical protein